MRPAGPGRAGADQRLGPQLGHRRRQPPGQGPGPGRRRRRGAVRLAGHLRVPGQPARRAEAVPARRRRPLARPAPPGPGRRRHGRGPAAPPGAGAARRRAVDRLGRAPEGRGRAQPGRPGGGGRFPGRRGDHRPGRHRLRAGLPGFPLRPRGLAPGPPGPGRLVRDLRRPPVHARHRADGQELTADQVIAALGLRPHPEGGHFRETFRDAAPDSEPGGGRGASTAIYFLLRGGEESAWHRVDAAEVWHHYAGAALALRIGKDTITLGTDLAAGQRPQAVVPAHAWQSARSLGDWTLVGCTVAPAFEFAGFEMAPQGWPGP
ncbi:MAG: cupin domain-containing protein [Hyphomicrobiales bacterium]|nr:cupin domain-containing protein [Hyphomicrobiales bacterium]MCP5372217.1 cupin domain-containing protein [Hyphomicrobiales bacterium]